jgi:hypothetical protein
MDIPDRWERWAPLSGVVFVASFLALFFLFFVPTDELPEDATAAQIADLYRGSGQAGLLFMYSLVGLAGAALLWFSGSLWAFLRRIEPAPGRLSAIAFGGGVASAILLLAGGATLLAPFISVVVDSREAFDPTLYGVLGAIGFNAINFGLLGAAVMVVATSLVALRLGGLPAWFTWVGFIVALALVLNILYFFGFFVWVAWVLLCSIVLLTRPIGSTPSGNRPAAGAP